ncbi:MAG: hypothetical protein HYZ29_31125 [Myxococcales bacterium]|nr:hypothetical protein [Myxococcales bacterium]
MTARWAATWGLALLTLVGCAGGESYQRRLRVPLSGDPAGDAAARACFAKCTQRDDDYRIAVCLRGCPAVQESEGACGSGDAGQAPEAGCFTWKTEGRPPNVPEPPLPTPGGGDGSMADLIFDVAAGAAIDLALPDFPDAPASEATTGGNPPRRSRPAHVPARPKKR